MKLRNSFVSNSSSTSFVFVFKGNDRNDLLNLLKKYDQFFSLYNPDYGSITFSEVYDSIHEVLEKKGVNDIQNLISEKEKDKNQLLEILESRFSSDMDSALLVELMIEIDNLKKLENDGFGSYFIINYGDNEGDVEGGKLGNGMDYVGRYISINKPELCMYTKQER